MPEDNALLTALKRAAEPDISPMAMGESAPRRELDAADLSLIIERHRELGFREGHQRGSEVREQTFNAIHKAAFSDAVVALGAHVRDRLQQLIDFKGVDPGHYAALRQELTEVVEEYSPRHGR
jgi:hypothetical protein